MTGQLPLLRSLVRPSRVTREEIVAFQDARLSELVAHAYARVPYYRALFDRSRVRPEDIRSLADLAAIPVTSRKDLQALEPADIVARGVNPARLLVHRTSGSSGEPLTIRRAWLEERIYVLIRLRALHALGLSPRDRQAVIGIVHPPDPMDVRRPQQILRAAGFYRKEPVDCRRPPEEIRDLLRRLRPDVLMGFPGVLSRVAQLPGEAPGTPGHPRLVLVGGEVLTPVMRRQIAEAFRAPVCEMYGSHEFKLIGWECRETGALHVCDDSVILEIVRNGCPVGPGERGEVVATSLHSFAMPFLRYRLGDIVTRGPASCPCGAPFSTIEAIQGRMLDYFPLPDGRVIHPYELVTPLVGHRWVRQYQLLQERVDRIVLWVVAVPSPSPEELAEVERSTREILGPAVELMVALVPEIPLEASGKFRPSRSLVASAYDPDYRSTSTTT